jgi:hypothetical protein
MFDLDEPEREVTLRLPESALRKLEALDNDSMIGWTSLLTELIDRAHDDMLCAQVRRQVALREADQPAPTETASRASFPTENLSPVAQRFAARLAETEPRGTLAGWLREGLAQVARDATPEQRQRVEQHPSGFLPDRGTPAPRYDCKGEGHTGCGVCYVCTASER